MEELEAHQLSAGKLISRVRDTCITRRMLITLLHSTTESF